MAHMPKPSHHLPEPSSRERLPADPRHDVDLRVMSITSQGFKYANRAYRARDKDSNRYTDTDTNADTEIDTYI